MECLCIPLYNICSDDIWQMSARYHRVLKRITSCRYLVDLCCTSGTPLEPALPQRCSRGVPEVKVPFLCAFVLRSLRTGVSPPHWAFGVSMTHGRCHFGCRSRSHELATPSRRQKQFLRANFRNNSRVQSDVSRALFGGPRRRPKP